MKTLHSIYTSVRSQLLYLLLMPTFFLVFVTAYKPQSIVSFIAMDGTMLTFNVTLLSCIILGVILLSRTMLCLTQRQHKMNELSWIIWQVIEIIVVALFMALYMTLMYHGKYPYFTVVGHCLAAVGSIEIFVYAGLGLIFSRMAVNESEAKYDDSLMRFLDNQKQVKLIIASSAVLYIEAKENYVLIKYMDGDNLKEYCLRSTMTALEGLTNKHGLIRCQRSYYVNPIHVKVLRKDKEGAISAELDNTNCKPIPVSPKYYEQLAAKL